MKATDMDIAKVSSFGLSVRLTLQVYCSASYFISFGALRADLLLKDGHQKIGICESESISLSEKLPGEYDNVFLTCRIGDTQDNNNMAAAFLTRYFSGLAFSFLPQPSRC